MVDLSFQIFDADNHDYEAEDAFTRHLDPRMRKRCITGEPGCPNCASR